MLILCLKFSWMAYMIVNAYVIKGLQVKYLVIFSVTEIADIVFAYVLFRYLSKYMDRIVMKRRELDYLKDIVKLQFGGGHVYKVSTVV